MAYSNPGFNSGQNVSEIDAKILQNQAQIQDLTNIMHMNIEKTMQRDINLNQLSNNIDDLQNSAGDFKTTATKTKKWYIWKNRKWTLILIIVIVVIILIIALAIGLGIGLAKN